MESKDIAILRKMAQVIFNEAPVDSRKIIMRAKLSLEDDACEFEFDWMNSSDEINWFSPKEERTTGDLMRLLTNHRNFSMAQNQPPWHSCEFLIDVDENKFRMNLFYENRNQVVELE